MQYYISSQFWVGFRIVIAIALLVFSLFMMGKHVKSWIYDFGFLLWLNFNILVVVIYVGILFGLGWLLIWALHLLCTPMLVIGALTGILVISVVLIVGYQLRDCWQIAIDNKDVKQVNRLTVILYQLLSYGSRKMDAMMQKSDGGN